MKKVVEKILIGKGDRLASVQITDPSTTSTYITEGQILVLDKNRKLMTAGKTMVDTDTIYIVEGTASTFTYVNEPGTTVTGARKLLYSDAIQGAAVVEYSAKAYDSPKEATFTISGTFTPVVGDVYKIRIVYKDMIERPGQFTRTYEEIATSVDPDVIYAAFVAQINADKKSRVTASYVAGTDTMTIVAKAYDNNESVTSICEYKQVNPAIFLYSDNFDAAVVTQTVYPHPGSGTWKLCRDEEKWAQGYEGQTNRTHFPVIGPSFRTVGGQTYDTIIIRHKNWFTTPNRREEQVDITTKLFLPTSSTQTANITSVLNTWMESTGRGLKAISL